VRRQGPCHSKAAIDTRRHEALQSASAGVRSIPFSVVHKGTSTEGGIRGFIAPGDVRAPITVCEQRIEVGGERGIRSLGHPLDSVSYTNHIAGNPRNASVAVGPCPFLPPEGTQAYRWDFLLRSDRTGDQTDIKRRPDECQVEPPHVVSETARRVRGRHHEECRSCARPEPRPTPRLLRLSRRPHAIETRGVEPVTLPIVAWIPRVFAERTREQDVAD
jgi:hypothetical protein